MTCEPLKISKIGWIVFPSTDRSYRASYLVIFPSGSYIVSHDFIDELDVDQSACKIKPYFLKESQIFIDVILRQRLLCVTDPLQILVFRKFLAESLECLNLEASPFTLI